MSFELPSVLDLHKTNHSWALVVVAFFLALFPRIWAVLLGAGNKIYDPKSPRDFPTALRNCRDLNDKVRGRLIRSECALNNAFENLPLFAIAVLAANLEGVDLWILNFFSYNYILCRAVYTWIYIWGQEDDYMHPLTRSMVWFASQFILGMMFLLPGCGKKYEVFARATISRSI
ncbi:MAPEG family-domain-containing protein [Hypoxylon trugodes]|uniref:MAPEG family-domain-containing protein n=1 Tax=Hypoxylon trugodes TaxID=326681 RepID=UPI00219A7E90|nr:MAPEG family-domain-containing protein [Hypoxylon trugodes]KAI1383390.1 MAPEG family-domain-containing protein [Hypoxylon trugodes]